MTAVPPKQPFPAWPRYSSNHPLERQRVSVHSVFRVFVGDVRLNCPGGGDVGVAASLIAFLPLGEAAPIRGARQPRIYFQRGVVVGDGLVEAAEPQKEEAAAVETVGVVRRQSGGCVAICEGERQIAVGCGAQPTAVVIGVCGFWIDLDRFRVVSDGAVEIALRVIGVAATVIGVGVIRMDLDRFRVVGDGAVDIAPVFVGDAAIVVGNGVFWIDLDRLRIVGDGAVEVALG